MSSCDTAVLWVSSVLDVIKSFFSSIHEFGTLSSNYGSLIAAIIVAFVLFSIRELFNKAHDYSGVYYTKSTVKSTSYNPYRGMQLFHTLVLYSDGYVVYGTSEKTGDVDKARSYEYQGAGKVRGEVSGRVERNYLRSSVMHIHIVEKGSERDSTSYMTIKVRRFRFQNPLNSGFFYSTAARSEGIVLCGREFFKDHPTGCLPFQPISE